MVKKIVVIFAFVALFMFAYEGVKEIFLGGLTKWESHAITIVLSAFFASLASYFVLRKIYALVGSLNRELSEKEVLLKEVHHRIKNNIVTIGGILRLSADSVSNPESLGIIHDAISRVESMRVMYDKLLLDGDYRETSARNYVEDLVSAILAIFPESAETKVDISVDDMNLDVKTLFCLGIIINELMTNAMKYAFTGLECRAITINLRRISGEVILTVRDNGRGLGEGFDVDKSCGFGLAIVKMLSGQLKGSFSVDGASGTTSIIRFKG